MSNHKRHLIVISTVFLQVYLSAGLAFGREYSSEPTEPSVEKPAGRPSLPSHPAPAKASPRAKSSAATYSTEDIAESRSSIDPDARTTGTRDHTVYRTGRVTDSPRRPEATHAPEAPKPADLDGFYPAEGGALHFRPGPYLAGRRGYRRGGRRAFWPGLWDTDISYSWSGNSGRGELTYWPYGYRYSWGDNSADSDTSGHYPTRSAVQSDPNTTNADYTTYSTEDIRPIDYRPVQSGEANETLPDAPVSDPAEKPKQKAAVDG